MALTLKEKVELYKKLNENKKQQIVELKLQLKKLKEKQKINRKFKKELLGALIENSDGQDLFELTGTAVVNVLSNLSKSFIKK